MPDAAPPVPLADGFAQPTRDEWRGLLTAVLAKSGRGDLDPEDALTTTTYDGIRIRPLYTADDTHGVAADGVPGAAPFTRGSTGVGLGWDVRVRHGGPDASAANRAVLEDLERGATSLWLDLADLPPAGLPRLLAGVHLDLAPVVLDAGRDTEAALAMLLDLAAANGVDAAQLSGSCGADPIGTRARTGAQADPGQLSRLAAQRGRCPLRVATVDATVYHDAGAGDAQELGIATAVGVAYLRELESTMTVDEALAAIDFRFAVTAEQFPSIAKLRAARRVWARVAQLCGATPDGPGQRQHAVTSAAMLTTRDPWVNMLRTTIGCFGAAVGGAEAITVSPFDSAIGVSDDLARRIARNTHAVLHDESSLARVTDAAGGSWFVESLTDELARVAWDVFTDIERRGGALACLDDGTLDALLATTRRRRDDDIAHRRSPITGVSEFAYVDEAPVVRPPATRGPHPGALLTPRRYAAAYEHLRDRADAAPRRPRVFLAGLGPVAAHTARAGFAANVFQAGGLDCVLGTDEGGTAGLVEAFRAAGTAVACLCSSDPLYAERAAGAAAALRDAGAAYVWLAGAAPASGGYGVDGSLSVGCDALEVLSVTFDSLGVPSP